MFCSVISSTLKTDIKFPHHITTVVGFKGAIPGYLQDLIVKYILSAICVLVCVIQYSLKLLQLRSCISCLMLLSYFTPSFLAEIFSSLSAYICMHEIVSFLLFMSSLTLYLPSTSIILSIASNTFHYYY